DHRVERQSAVEMREEITAAGGLELQRLAESRAIDGEQHQVLDAGKMQPCGLAGLGGGGEMDVAILQIDRRAVEDASFPRGLPQSCRNDLVDDIGHGAAFDRALCCKTICGLPQRL